VSLRRSVVVGSLVLLGTGGLLLGNETYLRAKGKVAEMLIDRACAKHFRDGGTHRPWSWADIAPVGQIEVPRTRIRRIILSGADGSSMAFGLGHLDGTARPGRPGNCAIAGHRDTWAAFLEDLRAEDEVRLRTTEGVAVYRVVSIRVIREDEIDVLAPSTGSRLTLITCYPFSGLLRSPWRYVVTCEGSPGARLEAMAAVGDDVEQRVEQPLRAAAEDRSARWAELGPGPERLLGGESMDEEEDLFR
jgi:sortase A